MIIFNRIGQLLGWVATKTSISRVRSEDKGRHARHGGSPRDLYKRADEVAKKLEKARV